MEEGKSTDIRHFKNFNDLFIYLLRAVVHMRTSEDSVKQLPSFPQPVGALGVELRLLGLVKVLFTH